MAEGYILNATLYIYFICLGLTWYICVMEGGYSMEKPAWKQSWSWPRISSRSCCAVLVELFLRTSFCWLENNGDRFWDNCMHAGVSIDRALKKIDAHYLNALNYVK